MAFVLKSFLVVLQTCFFIYLFFIISCIWVMTNACQSHGLVFLKTYNQAVHTKYSLIYLKLHF